MILFTKARRGHQLIYINCEPCHLLTYIEIQVLGLFWIQYKSFIMWNPINEADVGILPDFYTKQI